MSTRRAQPLRSVETETQPVDLFDNDEAFFAAVTARMDADDRSVVAKLSALAKVYVECGRDKVLARQFKFFHRHFIATRDTPRDEAEIFFLTGESGAGKTGAVQHLFRTMPEMQPIPTRFGAIKPYVSIKLRGYVQPRHVAQRILRSAGYPIRADEQRGDLWDGMAGRLRTRRTYLVHIDETQHLIANKDNEAERTALVNAIKGVSIASEFPVAFLLSGLPEIIKLPFGDEQMQRRANFVHFEDVNMDTEGKLVERILKRMGKAVDIDVSALPKTDILDRLAHAANYRYARITQVVFEALHEALHEGARALNGDHFAQAYVRHSMAQGRVGVNPFLEANWKTLDRGSFMIVPPDDKERSRRK